LVRLVRELHLTGAVSRAGRAEAHAAIVASVVFEIKAALVVPRDG
jgi:hypothetical protein